MLRTIILNIKNNYFEYALYFLAISLFFGNALVSIASSMFFIISIPSFFKIKKIKLKKLDWFKPFSLMVLYFLLNFIILCFVASKVEEVLVLHKYLPFILFPIIFLVNKKKVSNHNVAPNVKKIFLAGALTTLCASFLYGLFRMFFSEENINTIYITYNFITDLFGVHHIYLSIFYALAIIFCLDFYFYETKKRAKKIYLLLSAIFFMAIILLSSRTAIILTFVLIIIRVYLAGKYKIKELGIVLASITLLAIILTFSIPTLKERALSMNGNVSSYSGASFRFKVWENVLLLSSESPIYGFGIDKSQKSLIKQYHRVNFRRAYLNNLNAHNQYLQTLIDSGVIGLALLVLMLISPIIYFKKYKNILLFTILVSVAIISESFLIRQNGIVFYCLFLCLLISEID